MKKLLIALFVLFPALASAQIAPYPLGVTPPIFGLPASAVNGGGSFSPQLFGPESCTVPAYSFTGATTSGYGSTSGNPCIVVSGVSKVSFSSTAVTSSVPYLAPNGTAAAPSITFTNDTASGLFRDASFLYISRSGATAFAFGTSGWLMRSDGSLNFADGTDLSTASADLSLSRESAAVLQIGSDAAGVTNQMFKGPDRITSDGVGGNLTIAGGRNRGASAGGSLIFQTAPAAGAGVTGTLATRWQIDSTGLLVGGAGASSATDPAIKRNANNSFNLVRASDGVETGEFGAATLRASNNINISTAGGYLALGTANNPAIYTTAPTAAGTGMAFSVGTGSTAFAWTITISTANAQSAFTLTLPTATNAWNCTAQSLTNPGSMKIAVSSRSTTTSVLTQYSQTTGLAAAYADSNVLFGSCVAQ